MRNLILGLAALLAACTTDGEATPSPTAATTTTPSASSSPATPVFVEYPSIVEVADLPTMVRDLYDSNGWTIALALAPGVWTPLPDGMLAADLIKSGPLNGWCRAVDDFVQQHPGEDHSRGTCW